ncbi:phosphoenolpyruvate carboxykinase (ATP) [Deinococcus soli (ex Cha et al. 2016)]|uniref:Phosphoenolpyruvate carboxykinase (ATP) n=2 Tax=Deinococcus soli (ex Cha et al. 2016) TaxID=1309411 RepID=A0A0F7JJP7_9DEIO|nr:phosphoenolpyruvate carboxykinase (ATP) [Deinococcus soli (ex Cha et al. 2016)]AKH15927.1 phosphoenolpyruvate carboxykinase [ATP] [Deinococcus soli (ex Cha et al. 2016)]MDR6217272.1 phosphoenolpyruvate carboxykinase (ATP) [Deinococcus soli (ex Cha et al. 2016)]MDR6326581.1 phosphoenolpyruvate carboxykinase (ATP) [Deinococcus soli (ex Cha et al. 2016)]MDR6750692.1 phosphoenolpyruvate carboxykinase (ATP) [Deinococcus soli (ex Cha et al. 2016)]
MSLTATNPLADLGIKTATIHLNPGVDALYADAIRLGEGVQAACGPLTVRTNKTGRSPKDRFIVEDDLTRDRVWWGGFNTPISPVVFDRLLDKMTRHAEGKELFVQQVYAGTDPRYRIGCRMVTEMAYHSLFIRNMFVRPTPEELTDFHEDWTVLNIPSFKADPAVDGVRSDTFIIVNFTRKMIIAGGTQYAGENKKGIFGVLNYLLPEAGVMPMHCSANVGEGGDVALFFGLSGTGKTTLSADPSRKLIGDDEHGWTDSGVFNFEGGCYAKVINLNAEAEPAIHRTTRTYGTVLENVVLDAQGEPDLNDGSLTENTRSAYPIDQIDNVQPGSIAGHPKNVVFLTADAYGVLPPISRLSAEQTMYQFISGFTAKIPGTEDGVTEPSPTFSTCFGAPFMPRHPGEYARLLAQKVQESGARVWLVNTGWSGGMYGQGKRMSIAHTRAMINAALSGVLDDVTFEKEPFFDLEIPTQVPGVPAGVLNPRDAWADKDAYDQAARKLARMFRENFKRFEDGVDAAVTNSMPNPDAN